jgi:hypothetical protein
MGGRPIGNPTSVADSSFAASAGRTLGGSTNRRATDARTARLQALENRGDEAV